MVNVVNTSCSLPAMKKAKCLLCKGPIVSARSHCLGSLGHLLLSHRNSPKEPEKTKTTNNLSHRQLRFNHLRSQEKIEKTISVAALAWLNFLFGGKQK